MFDEQHTIILRSEDPHGGSITLDELRQLVAKAELLERVHTIELHEGEIFVTGDLPLSLPVPLATPTARLTTPIVPIQRTMA